jgi:hypothetical protein
MQMKYGGSWQGAGVGRGIRGVIVPINGSFGTYKEKPKKRPFPGSKKCTSCISLTLGLKV